MLEGDIGGGLVLQRKIYIPKNDPKVFRIESSIISHKVGAGSGGFSRFAMKITLSLSLFLFFSPFWSVMLVAFLTYPLELWICICFPLFVEKFDKYTIPNH